MVIHNVILLLIIHNYFIAVGGDDVVAKGEQ
jgi:hypothetical protein